jgi:hypothetical protein
MTGAVIGALVALSMVQQTDTTFAAAEVEHIDLSTTAGRVMVTGWDRSEIRVAAEHSSRTFVEIRRSRDGRRVDIDAEARRGPATIVDYELWVPRSVSIEVDSDMSDVTIEGVDGNVEVDVTRGDVTVRGGSGVVAVGSMTGKILIDGAEGRIEAETAADEIRLVNVSGEVEAESAGGNIILENARASSVDVGSVGGRIYYEGTYQGGGTYFFGSHGGSVTLVVAPGTSADFAVSTVHGSIVNALGAEPERLDAGERHRFTLGAGGALVEAETFGGRISLVRPGSRGSGAPPRSSASRNDAPMGVLEALGVDVGIEIGHHVGRAVAAVVPRLRLDVAATIHR